MCDLTNRNDSLIVLNGLPYWGIVGEEEGRWGKRSKIFPQPSPIFPLRVGEDFDMFLKVSPCFPHLPFLGEASQEQICATLLTEMTVW